MIHLAEQDGLLGRQTLEPHVRRANLGFGELLGPFQLDLMNRGAD
jgi:hypothetical protein